MTDKQDQQIQTAIRVPESWLDRLDKIAERMSRPGMRVTRAEALRMAAHRGIEALEAEGKKR
jgi:predicted DNA-binding protein